MSFDDRFAWLAFGCFIGFVLGYITHALQDIKENVEEVNENVKKSTRNERGAMRLPPWKDVALFLVVTFTVYASVTSQISSNKSNDTSDRIIALQDAQKKNQDCTTQILFQTVSALNERTTYSGAQADANVKLVKAQYDLLTKGRNPKLSQAQQVALYNNYVDQVQAFLDTATKNKGQQEDHPFPTVTDLTMCLLAK